MGQGLRAAVESVVHAHHRRRLRGPNHARWNRVGPPGPRRDPGLVHVEQSIMDLDRRGGPPRPRPPPPPLAPFLAPHHTAPHPPPPHPPTTRWGHITPSDPRKEAP